MTSFAANDVQAAFARVLVDEWVRAGVTDAVACPGSRSTPVLVALAEAAERGALRLHVLLDERSAGFFALGLGLASPAGLPAVVVTTSGTAAAELHPAVLEAHHSGVPMLAVTADRPQELQDSGAPQTVHQVGLYGDAVRWEASPGVPELAAAQSWRSLASRSVLEARGGARRAGPVHLNLAFREPLLGSADRVLGPGPEAEGATPSCHVERARQATGQLMGKPSPSSATAGPAVLPGTVCGPGRRRSRRPTSSGCWPGQGSAAWSSPAEATARDRERSAPRRYCSCRRRPGGRSSPLRSAVAACRVRSGPPTLCCGRRSSKGGSPMSSCASALPGPLAWSMSGWQGFPARRSSSTPGASGPLPTTSRAKSLLRAPWPCARQSPRRSRRPGGPQQPFVAAGGEEGSSGAWARRWSLAESAAQDAIDATLAREVDLTEPGIARTLLEAVPAGGTVVVSSSMPIRDVEWWGRPRGGLAVVANRGVNGIDGVLSTALGFATSGNAGPVTALLGDLAFLYDAGALLGAASAGVDLDVVVVDNDGGGIFNFLPQAGAQPPRRFERLWGTPHGADLVAVARGYGVAVEEVPDLARLAAPLPRVVRAKAFACLLQRRTGSPTWPSTGGYTRLSRRP